MGHSPKIKQFKINPVELVIFSVVSLMLLNSVYNLFYEHPGFHPTSLSTLNSSHDTETPKVGVQAAPMFLSYDLNCESNSDQTTAAGKVRLGGGFCGQPGGGPEIFATSGRSLASETQKLLKINVVNTANKFSATVFTDAGASKFTTDYIPLNQGKNPIQVDFFYVGGKTVTQTFNLERN